MNGRLDDRRAEVVSLQVGSVTELVHRNRAIPSGIRKLRVSGARAVNHDGLMGDEQADLVNHGGRDKALCAYPQEHYPYWSRRLGRSMPAAAFGENLTLQGLTEDRACIGDVYVLGTAQVQLSQPRQPCYKLAALHREPKLALWVQETGYTGFYFRVLSAGEIEPGDELVLHERAHPHLTVAEANRVMHHDGQDRRALERLLVPELAEHWRETFRRRLEGKKREDSVNRLRGR